MDHPVTAVPVRSNLKPVSLLRQERQHGCAPMPPKKSGALATMRLLEWTDQKKSRLVVFHQHSCPSILEAVLSLSHFLSGLANKKSRTFTTMVQTQKVYSPESGKMRKWIQFMGLGSHGTPNAWLPSVLISRAKGYPENTCLMCLMFIGK